MSTPAALQPGAWLRPWLCPISCEMVSSRLSTTRPVTKVMPMRRGPSFMVAPARLAIPR